MTWYLFLSILRRIGFFLLDNWKLILLAIAGIIVFFWILNFSFCSKHEPKPDLQEINRINTENEQRINRERLESEAQTANVLRETDTKIRESEKTPTRRTGNISGAELDKLAREQK